MSSKPQAAKVNDEMRRPLVSWRVECLVFAMLCILIPTHAGAFNHKATSKQTAKQADPYLKEIARSKNKVTISREFVDAVRKNDAVVLSRAAVRQRLDKNGRVEAVELVQIDKGSSVAKMGFEPGDRIKSVNGIPLRELEARRSEIDTANRWELTIVRQGKLRRIVIEVRD